MERVLAHIFERNEVISESGGGRDTPVCIWGTHGLGKTQMVKDYATSRGWHLAYCAPAQFEEMGDLHGLPTVHDPTPDKPFSGDEYPIFAPHTESHPPAARWHLLPAPLRLGDQPPCAPARMRERRSLRAGCRRNGV